MHGMDEKHGSADDEFVAAASDSRLYLLDIEADQREAERFERLKKQIEADCLYAKQLQDELQ
jgi:hypothetical protein